MLLAVAPSTLSTPCDKRSSHQQVMAGMINEVFEVEGQRLQLLVDEAQSELDKANTEKATSQTKIDGVQADLQAKIEEIKDKEAALTEDIDNTKEAKDELKEAADQQEVA